MSTRSDTGSSVADAGEGSGATSIVLLGIVAGVVTGAGEMAVLFGLQQLGDRMVFMGRHAIWMRPATEAVVFALAGVVYVLGARVLRRHTRIPGAVAIYGFLAALAALQLVPQIHLAAKLILAAGVGHQAHRWLGPLLAARTRTIRVGAGAGAAAVLLTALAWTAGARALERRALAALPAPVPEAPNVLLIILDTVRASSLSVYGHDRPTTPFLELLAGEALVFDRAISTAPWTLPSHASMFTGHEAHALSADWRRSLDDRRPTLAEHLGARGYATAGFVANLGYCGWESGLARGFVRYEDNPVSIRQAVTESSLLNSIVDHPWFKSLAGRDENFMRKSGAEVNRAFLTWLDEERPADRPFFAFLNYYDAHDPYQPPEPFRSRLATDEPRGPMSPLHRWNDDPFGELPSDSVIRLEREAYEGAIAYLDHQMEGLAAALRERGELDRTVLIIASDHGEEFGEHGLYDHGNGLYLEGIHVPLIIRYPARIASGGRVGEPVSLARLPATVIDLANIDGPAPFPGVSLLEDGAREGPAEAVATVSYAPGLPDWFPVSRGDMASVVRDRLHYILNGDGTEELYDLAVDPAGTSDLAGDPARQDELAVVRATLEDAGYGAEER